MFTVDELLTATGGELVRGDRSARVSGISTESRTSVAGRAFVALKGKNFDAHDFVHAAAGAGAACIVCERAPMTALPAPSSEQACAIIRVPDTTAALGDIARAYRSRFDMPLIAVTGSNGKTTTKDMIAAVLSDDARVVHKTSGTRNNHIGVPQTLLSLSRRHAACVIELGTNHPGEIAYLAGICLPTIGVITSIGESHLEFLRNVRGVLREKMSLCRFLAEPAILLLNADDPMLFPYIKRPPRGVRVFGYGISRKTDFFARSVRCTDAGCVFTAHGNVRIELGVVGMHNVYNSLAAIACARLLGVGYADIRARLAAFSPLGGRMRIVERRSVRFIDDTYNSNPLSLRAALETLAAMKARGRKIAVIGDMRELGVRSEEFHLRAGSMAGRVCDALIAVGDASAATVTGARRGGRHGQLFACSTVDEAREVLFGQLCPARGDIVLVKGSRSMEMERILDAV